MTPRELEKRLAKLAKRPTSGMPLADLAAMRIESGQLREGLIALLGNVPENVVSLVWRHSQIRRKDKAIAVAVKRRLKVGGAVRRVGRPVTDRPSPETVERRARRERQLAGTSRPTGRPRSTAPMARDTWRNREERV